MESPSPIVLIEKPINTGIKLSPAFVSAMEGAQRFDKAMSEFTLRYETIGLELRMGLPVSDEDKAFYEAAKAYFGAIADDEDIDED